MKKSVYLVAVIIMTIVVYSCAKKQDNYSTADASQTGQLKTQRGWTINVSFKAGHNAGALCMVPYLGDAVIAGAWRHIPCVGSGTNCDWTIGFSTNATYGTIKYNSIYSAIAILSEYDGRGEEEFVMPARSLLMQDTTSATSIGVSESDKGLLWINVSEQTWERIDSTHYQLATGIEFDTIPLYLP